MLEEADISPQQIMLSADGSEWFQFINDTFGGLGQNVVSTIHQLYPFPDPTGYYDTAQRAYDQIVSDIRMICGNNEIAQAYSAITSSPVYAYVGTKYRQMLFCDPAQSYCPQYAASAWDIQCMTQQYGHNMIPTSNPVEFQFGALLLRYFTQFAKTGVLSWDPVTPKHLTLNYISDIEEIKVDPKNQVCKFWKSLNASQFWKIN